MEEVYEVTNSDTLSGIALKYKMTVNEIQQLNQLFNNNVFPGQKLKVLKREDTQQEEKDLYEYTEHKVAPFESLAMIALAYDMKISELKSINSLNSNQVRAGEFLKVRAKPNVNKQEKKISIPIAPKKVEHNAIDITFELIKDFPSFPKSEKKINRNTGNKTVVHKKRSYTSPPSTTNSHQKIQAENIVYSVDNEVVDRIIREAAKSDLNSIVNNNNISEEVLKELEKLNTKKKPKEKRKNPKPIVEEVLGPPTLISNSTIIKSDEKLAKIRNALPNRYHPKRWTLLYSTQEHGISYQTFLRRVRYAEASLLFVEDSKGHVFGGFASSHWRLEEGFFGTGESFLFKLYPETHIYKWDPSHPSSNSYFLLCHNDHFEIGGGGHPGLWIDKDFETGTSGESNTFRNPVLSSTPDFVCTVLEFWGFTL